MSPRSGRTLLLAISLLALALSACGDTGDESASTASSEAQVTTASARQAEGPSDSSAQAKAREGQRSRSGQSPPEVTPPPISSAPVEGSEQPAPGVKTVKGGGGDNSVQTYGVESSEEERTEAAIALQAYLNARAERDWGRVCSLLAQTPKEQLENMARSAQGQDQEIAGCAGVMALLAKDTPRSELEQQTTITEVLSFRGEGDVRGDPSFLIFLGPPGQTLYSMPMYLEGGEWKVGLAQASELPV